MARRDSQAFERGLYEVIVTDKLEADLQDLAPTLKEVRQSLREPEAGDRLAFHLSQVVRAAINGMDEKTRVNAGISLTRLLTKAIVDERRVNSDEIIDITESLSLVELAECGAPLSVVGIRALTKVCLDGAIYNALETASAIRLAMARGRAANQREPELIEAPKDATIN